MAFMWRYVKSYRWAYLSVILVKLAATFLELLLPYVLEHLIDDVAPRRSAGEIFLWGGVMLLLALCVWRTNIYANHKAVRISAQTTYEIRRDLFRRSLTLSGGQVDAIGLPSLTSRMTSDSYNVQDCIRMVPSIGVRAPIMLLGGIIVTLVMDPGLSLILCVMVPIVLTVVVGVSLRGIPLYDRVQRSVDGVVRVMRENITGIRVVKALSKESHERARFEGVNAEMNRHERRAGAVMSLPGPVMTLFLNLGLVLVVIVGAKRVNAGRIEPGVILSFLTYFNMILMGVMGLNRVFLMLSKANASARRIAEVIDQPETLCALPETADDKPESPDFIVFDHVSFRYGAETDADAAGFAGGERQMSLSDISFTIPRGGSLGIIGPTGCGKTTIIRLLMRFYDCTSGHIFVDGRDVRSYDPAALRRRFGVVFQNDAVFADTLAENIRFGRDVDDEQLAAAAADAGAAEFIGRYPDGFDHRAAIHGADLSGGQRQRVLIARALAADPEILVLDDASSALDYRTDAAVRAAIRAHHSGATSIVVAQRVSSIMSSDQILVLDEGRVTGLGTHAELLETSPQYRDIYETQMGEGE